MICDARNFSFDEAIEEQAKHCQGYTAQSACNWLYETEHNKHSPIRIVDSCPIDQNTDVYGVNCKQTNQPRSFANFVPVVARGIPYLNVYCAACHGMMLKGIETITGSATVVCHTRSALPEYPLFYFSQNFTCESVTVNHLAKYTKLIKRIAETCLYDIDPPTRYCTGGKYQQECIAYKTASGQMFTAKNDACVACSLNLDSRIKDPISRVKKKQSGTTRSYINLFRFAKTYNYAALCGKLHFAGKPGDPCLVKKCQPGFRLHDGQCTYCCEP